MLLLVLSLIVVFGLFFTVDCLTKRPVIALRPRCPPLDFDGMSYSLRGHLLCHRGPRLGCRSGLPVFYDAL